MQNLVLNTSGYEASFEGHQGSRSIATFPRHFSQPDESVSTTASAVRLMNEPELQKPGFSFPNLHSETAICRFMMSKAAYAWQLQDGN